MNMVALIPARAGSRGCPGKNTRELAGHPLIAYTIAAAIESGVFQEVHVCSDDPATYQSLRHRAGRVSVSYLLVSTRSRDR
jgi:CMP-N,N'-diacetyllegionaminic acid synthase